MFAMSAHESETIRKVLQRELSSMPDFDDSSSANKPGQAYLGPARPPSDEELVLKVIPMPADTNGNGDIFGGWVMSQVDLAGSVIPARHAGGRIATVAVN